MIIGFEKIENTYFLIPALVLELSKENDVFGYKNILLIGILNTTLSIRW